MQRQVSAAGMVAPRQRQRSMCVSCTPVSEPSTSPLGSPHGSSPHSSPRGSPEPRRRKSTVAKSDSHYDNLAITAIQQCAIGLEECDADGSGTLNYEEFASLLTNVQHVAAPDAKMRSWFNVCAQRDVEVSSFTWFIISLMLANKAHGAPLVSG